MSVKAREITVLVIFLRIVSYVPVLTVLTYFD